MSVTPEHTEIDQATMRCPTCQAEQSWSAECRRCKADLSEYWGVWRAAREAQAACLAALQRGDVDVALWQAQRLDQLDPGAAATKLLTVCHLLRGDWPQALEVGGGCLSSQ